MRTSDRGVAFIAAHEGIVTKAYRDSGGVWTIGVGHTAAAGGIKPKAGMVISRKQALDQFAADLGRFEPRVAKRMGAQPQHVFDGSVSFDFNTGAIHRASWVAKFLARAMAAAGSSFMSWNRAGGRVIKGLTTRRSHEWSLIADGHYGTSGAALEKELAGGDRAPSAGTPAVWTKPDELRQAWGWLHTLGYFPLPPTASPGEIKAYQEARRLVSDGVVGQKTLDHAVRDFQDDNDLRVDGLVGPATRATLIRAVEAKTVKTTATGAGGAGVATGGGSAVTDTDVSGALGTTSLILIGLAVLLIVGFLVWRNRGRIFGARTPA